MTPVAEAKAMRDRVTLKNKLQGIGGNSDGYKEHCSHRR
jgi:hypothetical protein